MQVTVVAVGFETVDGSNESSSCLLLRSLLRARLGEERRTDTLPLPTQN
jgi:hypothetical protein